MSDEPNPGSDDAIEAGCICPVLDNSHGRGFMGQEGIFWITAGCPIHTLPPRFVVTEAPSTPDTLGDAQT